MPGKGHRVASHQARLGQRRRHGVRGATTSLEGKTAVQPMESQGAEGLVSASQSPPVTIPAHRGRNEPRRTVVEFIGPELKRIGVLAGTAFALLIILSFTLS